MTFKVNWEKAMARHSLPATIIEQMVQAAYPDQKLLSYQLIAAGGCNLNIRVQLDVNSTFILRVYLRDEEACYLEKKLGQLLKGVVPLPQIEYIGKVDNYRFATVGLIEGITLRDLLLGNHPYDMHQIMIQVGQSLAKISTHRFSQAGFFDKDLNVICEMDSLGYIHFGKECLVHPTVASCLSPETIFKIHRAIDKFASFFPGKEEKCLVHGDFDPSNILVNQVDGVWQVAGILDWEFTFSGSVLCDVANMLRYAHQMPAAFQNLFLAGLEKGGVALPANWQVTVHLFNLIALLDCLKRSEPQNCPQQCTDIRQLIDHILLALAKI